MHRKKNDVSKIVPWEPFKVRLGSDDISGAVIWYNFCMLISADKSNRN